VRPANPASEARTRRADRLREALRRRTGQHWEPTDALRRGLLVGLGLVTLGALTHRPQLLLIGAPLLLATVPAFGRRPERQSAPVVRLLPAPRLVDGPWRRR
jgi:hypothetical protein